MLRIKFVNDVSGTLITPINPNIIDPKDSIKSNKIDILHGSSIWHLKVFDDELRILQWDKYLISDTNMQTVDNYFRPIEGKVLYIYPRDVWKFFDSWPNSSVWARGVSSFGYVCSRLIKVSATYIDGNKLRFDSYQIYVQPKAL